MSPAGVRRRLRRQDCPPETAHLLLLPQRNDRPRTKDPDHDQDDEAGRTGDPCGDNTVYGLRQNQRDDQPDDAADRQGQRHSADQPSPPLDSRLLIDMP